METLIEFVLKPIGYIVGFIVALMALYTVFRVGTSAILKSIEDHKKKGSKDV